MTALIFANGGTLKEYVGDELMAIFGAPLEQPDHAARACRTAIAMRDRLIELDAIWADQGRPPLKARIGVNSGTMLLGNLGSSYRFTYGVLGKDVSLGSNMETLAGNYDIKILVAENTVRLVEDDFILRQVDMVDAKDRIKPIGVYELVAAAATPLPEEQANALRYFREGFDAYMHREWKTALNAFENALAARKEDGPSRVLAERCRIYQEEPPGASWDGVFRYQEEA
jgi:adenylate cyclase